MKSKHAKICSPFLCPLLLPLRPRPPSPLCLSFSVCRGTSKDNFEYQLLPFIRLRQGLLLAVVFCRLASLWILGDSLISASISLQDQWDYRQVLLHAAYVQSWTQILTPAEPLSKCKVFESSAVTAPPPCLQFCLTWLSGLIRMQACRSLLRRSIKLVLHLLHPAPDTRLGGPKKPLGEGVHLESSSELSTAAKNKKKKKERKKAAVWPSALLACISKAPWNQPLPASSSQAVQGCLHRAVWDCNWGALAGSNGKQDLNSKPKSRLGGSSSADTSCPQTPFWRWPSSFWASPGQYVLGVLGKQDVLLAGQFCTAPPPLSVIWAQESK